MGTNQFLAKRWRNVLLLFIVFLLIVFIQDVIREVFIFNQETEMIREELNRDVKNEVQANVESLSEDIYQVVEGLDVDLIKHSEDNLFGLIFASTNIVTMNPTFTNEQVKSSIVDLTHEYSTIDTKHDYFLYDTSGKLYYNGSTSSYDTIDMLGEEDYLNNTYIQEFVDEVVLTGSAAISYYEIIDNELTHLVLYGRKIEGTSYIVSNVVNMQNYSEERKLNHISSMSNKFRNSDDTIFVMDLDGTILYHPNSEYIGHSTDDSPSLLTEAVTLIRDFSLESREGFVEYELLSDTSSETTISRLTYVKVVEEWDIIIGSAVTKDKYDEIITNYTEENVRLILTIKLPSYILMIFLSITTYLYLKSTITTSQQIVEKEEVLYRKFADLTSEIIMITDKQGEIIFTNRLGKKAIFGKREDTSNVFFDQILVEEEGYYILYGYTENFFVKYINEPIDYNNVEADLYIITDVTEKITTERKLEELSLVDELTKMGNRRMMVREYNDVVSPYVKAGNNAYLVMIDLDDFKYSNDSYGHSYGDVVLKNVASIFNTNKDKDLLVYRIGGDEFAMIFLNNTQKEVVAKLNKMQNEIENYPYSKEISLSFSAGVIPIKVNDKNRRFSDYYDRADKLLYKSKKEGKHKINV